MAVRLDNDGQFRAELDPMDLESEWAAHSQMFYNAAAEAAQAELDYEEAKIEVVRTKAELDREIRDNPENYGIGKLTNEVVAQVINADKGVALAEKAANRAKFRMRMADARVETLQQKKRALTKLTDLFIHEYYTSEGGKTRRPAGTGEQSDEDKYAARFMGRRRKRNEEIRDERLEDDDAD